MQFDLINERQEGSLYAGLNDLEQKFLREELRKNPLGTNKTLRRAAKRKAFVRNAFSTLGDVSIAFAVLGSIWVLLLVAAVTNI